MTMPAKTLEVGTHLPTEKVSASARLLSEGISSQLEARQVVRFRTQANDGSEKVIEIEPDLAEFLVVVMNHLKEGEGVTYVPVSKRLTTQQAADILNVSRPFLIKLLERGDLPCEKINRHRRILARDLFAYKRKRDAERAEAMTELLRNDGELY
jgi:excisionase family DNA binding protein